MAASEWLSVSLASAAAGVRGRPYWLLIAGPLFALCLYTYGPAKLFVPLFLLGALVVYARRLWAVRRMTALAALLMVVTGLPVALFDVAHGERSRHYFRNTTSLDSSASLADNARRVQTLSRDELLKRQASGAS